jgi:hypothetical protein
LAIVGKGLIAWTTSQSNTELWPPIHKHTYTSGETAWQVGCMVQGRRIRATIVFMMD